MCGAKLADNNEISASNSGNTEQAVNSFELHETTKNRTIRANFTDKVGAVFAETLALFSGNRIKPDQSRLGSSKQNELKYNLSKPEGQLLFDHEIVMQPLDESKGNHEKNGNIELITLKRIFRMDNTEITLDSIILKASNKKDYTKRLTYLYLYAHKTIGIEQINRGKLTTILKELDLEDGNFRSWFSQDADIIKDGDNIRLRGSGIAQSKKYLEDIENPELGDGWVPGSQPSKPKAKKKSSEDSATDENTKPKPSKTKLKSQPSKDSRPGPTDILKRLINEGFFDGGREIQDIVKHCKDNLGYSLKSNDYTMPLLRLVRNEELSRRHNSAGRYEYYT